MWAFIACFQGEEVIFRQLSLKLKAGSQKTKAPKTLAVQEQIKNLGTRFYNNDIDHIELLDGL
jgi:hypothetical protein